MNICLAVYRDRIASLLETADRLIIVRPPDYEMSQLQSIPISNSAHHEMLQILRSNNVSTLICGAISGCVWDFFQANKIDVVPWITGNIVEVVAALRSNSLLSSNLIMPGCRKPGRFRHGPGRKGHRNF